MALGTIDRSLPPFFNQGPSVLSKLMFFGALSLFLMVADARFNITQPIRAALATALYPVQWLAVQPVHAVKNGSEYFTELSQAQSESAEARKKLALQSLRAGQVEQLTQENKRLRKLLELREQLAIPVLAAEVLYDAADPYTRKVIIDKGQVHKVELGSPVLDESGVLGQVTRVYPLVSEVTLVVDRDLAIPVLNVRTGARSVAYGDPIVGGSGMELRFMGSNADVQEGDLLTTSGVDGVYPPGLPVARVSRIERHAESAFSKIYCAPQALTSGARHVIVVKPITSDLGLRPEAAAPVAPARKGTAR
jgi:rod shape-determining protein MreC